MNRLFIIICAMLLLACGKNSNLAKEINKLTNRVIMPHAGTKAICNGLDSICPKETSLSTMVVWHDSLQCQSCNISKMHEWEEIAAYSKSLAGKFNIIFLFSPKQQDIHKVDIALRSYKFDYPVFVDEKSEFIRQNPALPSDNRLHTFLLDKNNKVVLVGNPLHNEKLWELYKSTIRDMVNNGGVLPQQEQNGKQ